MGARRCGLLSGGILQVRGQHPRCVHRILFFQTTYRRSEFQKNPNMTGQQCSLRNDKRALFKKVIVVHYVLESNTDLELYYIFVSI